MPKSLVVMEAFSIFFSRTRATYSASMPALVAGIHVLTSLLKTWMAGDRPGHDAECEARSRAASPLSLPGLLHRPAREVRAEQSIRHSDETPLRAAFSTYKDIFIWWENAHKCLCPV